MRWYNLIRRCIGSYPGMPPACFLPRGHHDWRLVQRRVSLVVVCVARWSYDIVDDWSSPPWLGSRVQWYDRRHNIAGAYLGRPPALPRTDGPHPGLADGPSPS